MPRCIVAACPLASGASACCGCAAAAAATPRPGSAEKENAAAAGAGPCRTREASGAAGGGGGGAAAATTGTRVGWLWRTVSGRGASPQPARRAPGAAKPCCHADAPLRGDSAVKRLVCSNIEAAAARLCVLAMPLLLLLLLLHAALCSSFFLVAWGLPLRSTATPAGAGGPQHAGLSLPFSPASAAAAPSTQNAAAIAAATRSPLSAASAGAAAFVQPLVVTPSSSCSTLSTPWRPSTQTPASSSGRPAATDAAGAGAAALPSSSAVRSRGAGAAQERLLQQYRRTEQAVWARRALPWGSLSAAAESVLCSAGAAASSGVAAGAPAVGRVAATTAVSDSSSSSLASSSLLSPAAAAEAGREAAGGSGAPVAVNGKQQQLLVSPYVAQMLYEDMLLGRSLEDACFRLYYQGKTAGFVHLYTGQEAVSSGVIKLLRQDDAVVSTYRDHVHASSKGVPPREIMAELFGKSTGCSRGRGGSMHMFSKKYNLIGGFAFIGEQIPIALGYAFSAAYRRFALSPPQVPAAAAEAAAAAAGGTTGAAAAAAAQPERHDQVTVCFLGDGTTNIGQLWEALNIAALAKLPVVFVVENNNWAIGMAAQRSTAIPRVWQRAQTFGVAGVEVDGMDVLAVRNVARRAIERARKGEGPTLIEALTYRFRGHSVADPDEMRAPKQKEAWVVRDPILAFEEQLKLSGFANDDTIRQTRKKVDEVIRDAVQFAEKSVESPVQECGSYIFAPSYPGGTEEEKLSEEQLHAYAEALKEELDWKARVKAGDRTPRPPVTQAFKAPTIID